MIKKIYLIILFLLIPNISYAYLDPGMLSYVVVMIATFFATLITFYSIFIKKLKALLNKILILLKKINK